MIKKITTTVYKDEDNEFEYTFEPIEDSVSIEKTPEGYKVKYLVQDDNPMSPNEWDNDEAFLVHYHRQFWIEHKDIEENDLADYFTNEEIDKDHYLNDYYVFLVSAYIHSGVALRLGVRAFQRQLPQGHYEFDVSCCGAVLVKKKEFGSGGVEFEHSEEEAERIAQSIVDEWNVYLSGDVYGCIAESFDKEKNSVDHDSCWGFYGYDYAMESLKNEF
jgi:hypothetical protein